MHRGQILAIFITSVLFILAFTTACIIVKPLCEQKTKQTKLEKLNSSMNINMHTHDNCVTLTFNLRVNACWATAMNCNSTKFALIAQAFFLFEYRHTESHMQCNVIWICIAHNRGSSNALHALVRCKQKRLQLFSKTVSDDGPVSQILWQWVPSRWACHRKSSSGKRTQLVARYVEMLSAGGSETHTRSDRMLLVIVAMARLISVWAIILQSIQQLYEIWKRTSENCSWDRVVCGRVDLVAAATIKSTMLSSADVSGTASVKQTRPNTLSHHTHTHTHTHTLQKSTSGRSFKFRQFTTCSCYSM